MKDHHPEQEIQAISTQWTKYAVHVLHIYNYMHSFSVALIISQIFMNKIFFQ